MEVIRIERAAGEVYLKILPILFDTSSRQITDNTGRKFTERISRSALDQADMSNIKLTINHDKNKTLARTPDTLKAQITERGLEVSARLNSDITLHKDTIAEIERGILPELSFRATVTDYEDKNEVLFQREIKRFGKILDVSLVYDGAYPANEITIERSGENLNNVNFSLPGEILQPTMSMMSPNSTSKNGHTSIQAPEMMRNQTDFNHKKNKMKQNFSETIQRALETRNIVKVDLLEIERAAGDGEKAGFANAISAGVLPIDFAGYVPIYKTMGCNVLTGLNGTVKLPYDTPMIGEKLAELAAVTGQTETMDGTSFEAARFSTEKTFTVETLNGMTPEAFAQYVNQLDAANHRALTKEIFSVIIAAAGEVAAVTDVSEDSLNALSAACMKESSKTSYFMSNGLFYASKSIKLDAGSGVNLIRKAAMFAETFEGDPVYYSDLWNTDTLYAAGEPAAITVGIWGNTLLIDPYTKANTGQVVVTSILAANAALTNPNRFAKSATLA
ncbi:HK97 family phage prohead protease [Draconibacterium orientale]|uniref:HK97 family phage prohead protease n=1 Tax=Draconibacterium orientale TaxID=1168034 RepID=UPI0029C07B39|nr:HK97 family phage prohead protease [Draconibacterium orientale]